MNGTNSCTNGARDNAEEKREEETLINLINVINEAELTPIQLSEIIPKFLFSIGASLCEDGALQTAEDVLLNYAKNPTLGSALMAQALWMRDNWKVEKGLANE